MIKSPFFYVLADLLNKKNYTYLIDEYSNFLNKYSKFNLIIIGDGEEKNIIEKLIKKNALCESLSLFQENEDELKNKRIITKKSSLNYTMFRHHKKFYKILNI